MGICRIIIAIARAPRKVLCRLANPTPDEAAIAYKALSKSVKQGLMLDVGAHHGSSCARFVREGWIVHAFEPDDGNRAELVRRLGKHPNLHIDGRAVADQPRSGVEFYTSEVSTGISGLMAFHESHRESAKVDVTTVSDYLAETALTTRGVDFLKIDTEGYDLKVLEGVPWETSAPRLILCEFEDGKTRALGYTFTDLTEFLAAKGYRMIISEWYPIERYGGRHKWRRFQSHPLAPISSAAWGNVLATTDEVLHAALLRLCRLEPQGGGSGWRS
jgi:FkbM family methyltransferase